MKIKILLLVFFVSAGLISRAQSAVQTFDKTAFYSAMESGKMDVVNNEIDIVSASQTADKEGYEGALLMRKAGLLKVPAEKLKYFKRGRIRLETALLNDPENTEYHFLRLTVQEHAPKIVKYNKELEMDKKYVKRNFKNLSPAVQQIIVNYSKSSGILSPQDF